MKKIYKLLFILAVLALPVNFVLAAENPFTGEVNNQPDLNQIKFNNPESQPAVNQNTVTNSPAANIQVNDNLILLNTLNLSLGKEEVWEGKKTKVFDNKFVFQIDEKDFKADANLELKEMMLAPASKMAPPNGLQMASRIYQYDLKPIEDVKFEKDFWISIKYDQKDYFRKNLYYYDETSNQWKGIKTIISDGASKLIAKFSLPYAKVAILEDLSIMTEGTASWYKYKGCNCAASPDYPKGTKLKVTNLDNGKSIVVKVNDWGPDRSIFPERVIDLDAVAFKKIARKGAGLCRVSVEPYNDSVVSTLK